MEKDTRVELTEERVREIVREELAKALIVREEIAKALIDIVSRSLEESIKTLTTIWS